MKLIAPDYFASFSCIAGACKHTCCAGWEIDIDEDTREYYRTVPGEIGKKLAENIDDSGEIPCFRMAEGMRCPFLNRDNLCELVLTLGEESLGQICSDHPRFRNFFSDRTEIGLGLTCEAAGRLILSWPDPVTLTESLEYEGEDDLPDEEAELLSVRDRLTAMAQDRSLSIEERIDALFDAARLHPHENFPEWATFLQSLERLDDAWADTLETLKHPCEKTLSEEWEIPSEQLLVYLLYRHIPGVMNDGDLAGRIACCALMCRLLRQLLVRQTEITPEAFVELARLYSSEIEYSDENLDEILCEIHAGQQEG